MAVDYVNFGGWKNNLRIANESAELLITLEVGPRIISYRTTDGANVFKNFEAHLGRAGESEWMSRGGHRFWLAPEHAVLSYLPDNEPFEHRLLSDFGVELANPPAPQLPIRKVMTVELDPKTSRVTVTHRAENHGRENLQLATWGLSVMNPGGVELIPLPPLGEHPRDLLPNRPVTLWPFTDMTDPRYRWGRRFIQLQQANAGPTKLGLLHREGWIGYHCAGTLFLKTIEFREGATYPDFGSNFETFTNEEMLEVESLGPLADLAPGAATGHVERWDLFARENAPPLQNEDALADWVAPSLVRAGIGV